MNLIEAFERRSPEKVIETIISKIFFFGDKVFKVYKYEKFFFGNFGDQNFRKNFYQEDFYWNNLMAPQVYLALHSVKAGGKEDFFIEMKKFDDSKTLANMLMKKEIDDSHLMQAVKDLILRLRDLTKNRKEKYNAYFAKKLCDIHAEDLESDRNLMYLVPKKVSKERADKIVDSVKKWCENSHYYKNFDSSNLSCLIDDRASNLVFQGGTPQFIDVLPPRESWRAGDLNFVVCRLATDVAVLLSKEKAQIIYNAHEEMGGILPPEIKAVYEARSGLIQAWCFHAVNEPETAEKYLKFAEKAAFSLSA